MARAEFHRLMAERRTYAPGTPDHADIGVF